MPTQRCLNLWALTPEILQLPKAERLAVVKRLTVVSGEGGFAARELVCDVPISAAEELAALASLSVVMGGPLAFAACGLGCLVLGSWSQFVIYVLVGLVLAFHPLPVVAEPLN